MLMGEPGKDVGIAAASARWIHDGKVAVWAHTPYHRSVSRSVGVVDFQRPILAAFRDQDVSVRRVLQSVGVRPIVSHREVRIEERTTARPVKALVIQRGFAGKVLMG